MPSRLPVQPVIRYEFVSEHIFKASADGDVGFTRPLPAVNGLYVIHHEKAVKKVYVGIAQNYKNRFAPRLEAYREAGLTNNQLNRIKVYIVRSQVYDMTRNIFITRQPDAAGLIKYNALNIDVEHLLIRLYCTTIVDVPGVRNKQKTTKFVCPGASLTWSLSCPIGVPHVRNDLIGTEQIFRGRLI